MSYRLTGSVLSGCLVGAALVANLIAIGSVGAASMYTWRDANGVLQFSDTCPPGEDCIEKPIGASAHAGNAVAATRRTIVEEQGVGSAESSADADARSNDADESRDAEQGQPGEVTRPGDGTVTGFEIANAKGNRIGLLLSRSRLTDSTPAGYRVYYARTGSTFPALGQGIDVGKATSFVLRSATRGGRYKFKISAYDDAGNEIVFSDIIYETIP